MKLLKPSLLAKRVEMNRLAQVLNKLSLVLVGGDTLLMPAGAYVAVSL
ncbi:hypothetical protein [uncultured Vibrio sp.]|nr:hypothetical protein [uncultured Vibrio sp.]